MNEAKQNFSNVCKKLYDKGFSPGYTGNVSLKIKDKILVTPSGFSLGDVEPENVVAIDFYGNVLEGAFKPTSEKFLHIGVYKKRPDISAVIHCHAPKSSAFAVAGIPLSEPILSEHVLVFGEIPIAKYALFSTETLAEIVSEHFIKHDAVLMANHGVITGGKDLKDVFYKMETIEYCAEVYLYSKLLGNINCLTKEEVEQVVNLKQKNK
jgi:L-fuculose-phosphate aldolase